jgi:murein DD-endopeptidase MepM/ murein hydrolase activator NlpD
LKSAVVTLRALALLCLMAFIFQGTGFSAEIPQPQEDFEQQEMMAQPVSSVQKKRPVKADPDTIVYTVRKGDTLFHIARQNGVSPSDIMTANGISSETRFLAGMKIKIPCSKGTKGCFAPADEPKKNDSVQKCDGFQWPVSPVMGVGRDGDKGVKPIGVIIKSRHGADVKSASSGTVEKIGRMRGFGNFIVLRHPGGYVSVYSGLGNITVKEGFKIKKGFTLGEIEDATGELHFMIHKGGKPEDPLKLLPEKKL